MFSFYYYYYRYCEFYGRYVIQVLKYISYTFVLK